MRSWCELRKASQMSVYHATRYITHKVETKPKKMWEIKVAPSEIISCYCLCDADWLIIGVHTDPAPSQLSKHSWTSAKKTVKNLHRPGRQRCQSAAVTSELLISSSVCMCQDETENWKKKKAASCTSLGLLGTEGCRKYAASITGPFFSAVVLVSKIQNRTWA